MSTVSWAHVARQVGGFLLFFIVGCLVLGQLFIMWVGVSDFLPTLRLWLMVQPTIWALALLLVIVFCTSFFRGIASEYHGTSRWKRRAVWFYGHIMARFAFLFLVAVILSPYFLTSGNFSSFDVIYPQGHPEQARELCGTTLYRPDRDVVDRYVTAVPVWCDGFTVWCNEAPSVAMRRTSAMDLHVIYESPENYRRAIVSKVSAAIEQIRSQTPDLGTPEFVTLLEKRLPALFPDMRFNFKQWQRPCANTA